MSCVNGWENNTIAGEADLTRLDKIASQPNAPDDKGQQETIGLSSPVFFYLCIANGKLYC